MSITTKFSWSWNCGSPNDIDCNIRWGDEGRLIIQRYYLRKIIYKWRFFHSIDGWIEETRTFELEEPVSELYTFPVYVGYYYGVGKNDPQGANKYWGKIFKVEAVLYLISGKDEILDEEYFQYFIGCFRRRDSYFDQAIHPDCIPPDIDCDN